MPSPSKIIEIIKNQPEKRRISSLVINGKKIWVKRPETIRHWRDGYKKLVNPGFKNEVDALLFLNKMNAPAPKVIASGSDFLALEDAGESVKKLIDLPETTLQEKHDFLYQAGYVLGNLHNLNLAHGRPALRDMCWDGKTMCLVDFERHTGKLATRRQKVLDILIFIHGLLLYMKPSSPGLQKAIDGYFAAGGETYFKSATALAVRLKWLIPVLRTIKPIAGRDLGLVLPTIELLVSMNNELEITTI